MYAEKDALSTQLTDANIRIKCLTQSLENRRGGMRHRILGKEVIALTFDELVVYGIMVSNGEGIHNGMPWSFTLNGVSISHENNECYVVSGSGFHFHMLKDDMLIVGSVGEVYVCPKHTFDYLCSK